MSKNVSFIIHTALDLKIYNTGNFQYILSEYNVVFSTHFDCISEYNVGIRTFRMHLQNTSKPCQNKDLASQAVRTEELITEFMDTILTQVEQVQGQIIQLGGEFNKTQSQITNEQNLHQGD